jgi:hypothetical protein
VSEFLSTLSLSSTPKGVVKHQNLSLSHFREQKNIVPLSFIAIYNLMLVAFSPMLVAFSAMFIAFPLMFVAFAPMFIAFAPMLVAFAAMFIAFPPMLVAFSPMFVAFSPMLIAFSAMFVAFSPMLIAFPGRHFHGFRYNYLKNSATPASSEVITVAAADASLYTYILLLRTTVLLYHKRLISLNLIINQLKYRNYAHTTCNNQFFASHR